MTSTPSSRARIVAAAMTLLRPGAGPPPHRIASLLCVSMFCRGALRPALRAARLRPSTIARDALRLTRRAGPHRPRPPSFAAIIANSGETSPKPREGGPLAAARIVISRATTVQFPRGFAQRRLAAPQNRRSSDRAASAAPAFRAQPNRLVAIAIDAMSCWASAISEESPASATGRRPPSPAWPTPVSPRSSSGARSASSRQSGFAGRCSRCRAPAACSPRAPKTRNFACFLPDRVCF